MKKKLGLTLAESLIALSVLGVVCALTMTVNRNFSSETKVNLSIKKASQTLTDVVQDMLDDANFYGATNNFSDMNEVRLNNGQRVSGEEKFRELFKSKIILHQGVSGSNILLCPILVSDSTVSSDEICYMTQDGIVWGIPDSDFKTRNVVSVERRGYTTPYLPITVYANCEIERSAGDSSILSCKSSDDGNAYFDGYAVVFAVRQDGDIRPYSRLDCDNSQNSEKLQCRLAEIISNKSF